MSRKYKQSSNAFNLILIIVLLFVLTPSIPFTLLIFLVCYFGNIKAKYCFIAGSILFSLLLIFDGALQTFAIDFGKRINVLSYSIISQDFFMNIFKFQYNLLSYFFIAVISFVVAGYFLLQIEKLQLFEKAGVSTLKSEIKSMYKAETLPEKVIANTAVYQDKILIGYNKSHKPVFCLDKAKHIFIAGTTGSGKTVFLSNYIYAGVRKDYPMLIIDGKGDIGKGSILDITKKICFEEKKKLYVIDMNNPTNSTKYNPFFNTNETVCTDMLISMSEWSEEHYKINAQRYIQKVIKMMNAGNIPLSFSSICEYLDYENFITLSAKLAKESLISKGEHIKNTNLEKNAKIVNDSLARFATIAESIPGQIFSDCKMNIGSALSENAVILFVLNPLLYPETSGSLGRLILIDAKQAVSKLFQDKKRKFFMFDEMNVYMSRELLNLINKSRSASVTCLCAIQSVSDLNISSNDDFKQQVIENCNNFAILRQNSYKSAEELAKIIGTSETMEITHQLNELESTGKGSAKRVRKFVVHPDKIKSLKTGECYFFSKDTGENCEHIRVVKPFI